MKMGFGLCAAWFLCGSVLVADHAVAPKPNVDRFGGFSGIQRQASGFFRVEQVGVRWLFITPEGHGYFALGANHLSFFMDAMSPRFNGDQDRTGQALAVALRDLGLNAGDAYAMNRTQAPGVPWVASLRYPDGDKFQFDMFNPEWQEKLRQTVVQQCRQFADDRFVLGVAFIDLPHWGNLRIRYFRNLPAEAPGKKRYEEARAAGLSDEEFLGIAADALYAQLKAAVREGAPNHLFFGEKFQLRDAPDTVLRAVGKHVDVFCTQALVRSPQRPPEWEVFQKDIYAREYQITGKPMLIIDWSSPFSLGEAFDSPAGPVKPEAEAAAERATWLIEACEQPYLIGVFRCMLVGTHPNDKQFGSQARRSCLQDDGTPFPVMTVSVRQANEQALRKIYKGSLEAE